MPIEDEKLEEQIRTLRKEMDEILRQRDEAGPLTEIEDRVSAIEASREDAFGWDDATPDVSRSGDLMDVRKMPVPIEEDFEVMPFEIEFGVPKADVAGSSATVELRPVDQYGREFTSAADIDVYVANDRQIQVLEDRRWTAKATGTMSGTPTYGAPTSTVNATAGIFTGSMVGQRLIFDTSGNSYLITAYTGTHAILVLGDAHSEASGDTLTVSGTILSFIRFAPTIDGVEGTLIGEPHRQKNFMARLISEGGSGTGDYGSWEEMIPDGFSGTLKVDPHGRNNGNTGQSLYESNGRTGIYSAWTDGTIVWVHTEGDDTTSGVLFTFDYQGDTPTGPLFVDKWYDNIGDVGWTTFNTEDWRLRFADVAVWVMDGAPVRAGARTIAATTAVWSYFTGARVQVLADDWIQTWINAAGGSGTDQEIIYVSTGSGEFFVRCEETTGNLQYRIINWSANFNVRFRIESGGQIQHSDAEQIGTPP